LAKALAPWAIATAAIAIAIILRNRLWARLLAIVLLVCLATFGWFGVLTSHRIAIEKAGVSWNADEPFIKGVLADHKIAVASLPYVQATLLGFVVLALLPRRSRR
jgi:hypothetical protein